MRNMDAEIVYKGQDFTIKYNEKSDEVQVHSKSFWATIYPDGTVDPL